MEFPQARMRFVTTYQGKTNPGGWLLLDLTGVDLDGVNKVYIPYEQLEKLKAGGDKAANRLEAARSLLAVEMVEEEED